ncbi:MAG: KUP/HAK/KT family potassium transporter [Methylobacter sp.]|nr:KUP/HAK/KT family potassium transporter [Methylobacter sp.]
MSLDTFLERLDENPPVRVSGTAVFMTGRTEGTPPILLHHLEHNQAFHQQVVPLTVVSNTVPRVPAAQRLEISSFRQGFYRVFVSYGFMQSPNIPVERRECERLGLTKTTCYLGPGDLDSYTYNRDARLEKNLVCRTIRQCRAGYRVLSIPPEHVVVIGIQVEL